MITQINARDHEQLQAFSSHRKAQVMQKIMSVAPAQKTVHQGKNRYEKIMMNLHRECYELIDLQPYEGGFISVWYRKYRSLMGQGADVTQLVWEDGEQGDTTTLMSWRI